jgi:hypothetical protein
LELAYRQKYKKDIYTYFSDAENINGSTFYSTVAIVCNKKFFFAEHPGQVSYWEKKRALISKKNPHIVAAFRGFRILLQTRLAIVECADAGEIAVLEETQPMYVWIAFGGIS